jgi:hypothetical protein
MQSIPKGSLREAWLQARIEQLRAEYQALPPEPERESESEPPSPEQPDPDHE